MTAWRIVTKALHDRGGSGDVHDLLRATTMDTHQISSALAHAKRVGVVHSSQHGAVAYTWTLTQTGIDWCEGRVTQIELRPGGRRWVSTWLASLPRGIRLQAEQPQECQAA